MVRNAARPTLGVVSIGSPVRELTVPSASTDVTGKREEEGGQPHPKGVVHPRELPLGLVGRRLSLRLSQCDGMRVGGDSRQAAQGSSGGGSKH